MSGSAIFSLLINKLKQSPEFINKITLSIALVSLSVPIFTSVYSNFLISISIFFFFFFLIWGFIQSLFSNTFPSDLTNF